MTVPGALRRTLPLDDLGTAVPLPARVSRVVSLVPSLTEAIAVSYPDLLVGATEWCTHPTDLDVRRVRGTKNPDCKAIIGLAPDLVVAAMEENRELDVHRLREAGIAVWVTRIESVPQALASMRRLFEEGLGQPSPPWLLEAEDEWLSPVEPLGIRAAVAIWRDPWMVVGHSTFAGDVVSRIGLTHAFADHADRYPAVTVAELTAGEIDVVLLPDEPYVFSADDGPEALAPTPTVLLSGRLLTWYGPSLCGARSALRTVVGDVGGRHDALVESHADVAHVDSARAAGRESGHVGEH